MPELPDITLYLSQLTPRIVHQPLLRLTIRSPFVLRSVDPPPSALEGKRVVGLTRMGKRIVFSLQDELFIVVHLMIAGRFRWYPPAKQPNARLVLAVFEFPNGILFLTEAGTKRRASIHLIVGRDALQQFDRGGLEVLEADLPNFAARLRSENH